MIATKQFQEAINIIGDVRSCQKNVRPSKALLYQMRSAFVSCNDVEELSQVLETYEKLISSGFSPDCGICRALLTASNFAEKNGSQVLASKLTAYAFQAFLAVDRNKKGRRRKS